MAFRARLAAFVGGITVCSILSPVRALPPTPDHVVIVIEENHSASEIIGSPEAPYMNSLAAGGANLTRCFALTHPSQPNYLQFFSGANQGVTDNTVSAPGAPYSTPNLGAAIIAAGRTFAGYSEDLPAIGSTVVSNLAYARRHNPWVNWQGNPPGAYQLPAAVNRPFFSPGGQAFYGDTNSPVDYSALPHVSIVVPNLLNDMHDGTIAEADAWLENHIKPYADWAMQHNSLLVVTWDEDDSLTRNQIATMLYGPMIVPGANHSTWTLHNLQRTIEDMYGATHSGSSNSVRPIVGGFVGDPPVAVRTFRQGLGGYASAHDSSIEQANPNNTHGSDGILVVDGSPMSQGLIRFDNVIGNGTNQVPRGVTVLSAKLLILTGGSSATNDSSANTMSAYAMRMSWSETSTWNSMVGGVSTNGVEAAATADFPVIPNVLDAWAIFDVTTTVQSFANDPAMNFGWLVHPSGTDGWRWPSSETSVIANRPMLEVTYDPTSCRAVYTQHPASRRANVGEAVSFACAATGGTPIIWQWRRNGVQVANGGSVSGATTTNLKINPVAQSDAGTYDSMATNACGEVGSNPATLLVCVSGPGGDMNGDGVADGDDISPFCSALINGSTAAADVCAGDFSANLRVDSTDTPAFIGTLLGL